MFSLFPIRRNPKICLFPTVHDLKLSHFFQKKTSKKCENLGTFTQKVTIWKKSVTIWKKCDNLEKKV